jgi:hypothetical protein
VRKEEVEENKCIVNTTTLPDQEDGYLNFYIMQRKAEADGVNGPNTVMKRRLMVICMYFRER